MTFSQSYFGATQRLLILALTLALVGSTLNVPAFSAVKAGATCKNLGASKSISGKKYICIKSGRKFIWNKGVSLPIPTPVSTPTPAAKNLTALEKMNLDIYSRYKASDKTISPSFNFVRCPNVNRVMADLTENSYIDAYGFWNTVYKSSATVNWLLMSEKDWDCWNTTIEKFEGAKSGSKSGKLWNKETGMLGHCRVRAGSFCGYGTGVREGGIFAQYNLIGSDYKTAPTPLTVHHETVHIYQMQLISDNFSTSRIDTLPCWFMEGQANLFGEPISMQGAPEPDRNFEKGRLLEIYPGGSTFTSNQWLTELNDLKTRPDFCFRSQLGYSLGWFALEWTYMNFSIEEMHLLLESITKGDTWEQAVEKFLKMDEQAYLGKIAEYLAAEL